MEIAKDSGGLAGCRIFFGKSAPAVGDFEILIDAGELERQGVEGSIWAGCEDDGIVRRDTIQFLARGVTLLFEASDEDLADVDPFAFANSLGTLADVFQNIGDGFHGRHGM